MLDPKDIVAVDRSGMRTGALAVITIEAVVLGLVFVDTAKIRALMVDALDSRWTPFRKKEAEWTGLPL